ncbi:MAG: bifunctional riboflavin kinase/FAD synthetase [Ekhidna sp.]
MEVIDHIESFDRPQNSVVTIGTFDGVHIGHQTILHKLVNEAKKIGGKSILITFWPHPRFILNKESKDLKLLSTFNEKVTLIEELGVDLLIKIAFTPEFASLSAEQFVKEILVDKVGTKKLLIGYDHHFGNNREGNIDFLKSISSKYEFEVDEILRQDIDDVGISSTKIRNSLQSGEIHLSNSLLGRPYTLEGKVIDGNKKGRLIGFPTANIELPEFYKQLPSDGVYAVKVVFRKEEFNGMLNIGFKPTVEGVERTIEAHLFNFDQQIYGEQITIQFIRSLRKEMKFNSMEELREQLGKDKKEALKILV